MTPTGVPDRDEQELAGLLDCPDGPLEVHRPGPAGAQQGDRGKEGHDVPSLLPVSASSCRVPSSRLDPPRAGGGRVYARVRSSGRPPAEVRRTSDSRCVVGSPGGPLARVRALRMDRANAAARALYRTARRRIGSGEPQVRVGMRPQGRASSTAKSPQSPADRGLLSSATRLIEAGNESTSQRPRS